MEQISVCLEPPIDDISDVFQLPVTRKTTFKLVETVV